MLGGQGIAGEIQRKKEAYQGNPQALQQQYQQSQQLVDLLALQQLKSEKEAAARQMQMQMQQNPATIAQQREQEVLGMIKQEQGRNLGDVAKRTAGTLGQINKNAQQNVQRTAKQGLPAMGGPQMAAGGIVGFDGGGVVTSEDIADFKRSNPRNRGLSDERIKQIILKRREAQEVMGAVGTGIVDVAKAAAGQPTSEIEAQMAAKAAPTAQGIAAVTPQKETDIKIPAGIAVSDSTVPTKPRSVFDQPDINPPMFPKVKAQPKIQNTVPPVEEAPTTRSALAAALSEKPERSAAPAMGVETSQELKDALKRLEGGDPATAGIAARDRAYGAMGKTEGIAAFDAKSKALEKFDAQRDDPRKQSMDAQRAGLLAMSRSTLGRGARASFNTRMQQEADTRKRLVERHNVDISKISFIQDVGKEGEMSYRDAAAQVQQNNRASADIYGAMNSQDRADARERSRQHFDKAQQDERHWLNTLIAAAQNESAELDREEARLARDAGYAQTFISNQTARLTSLIKAKDDALRAEVASDPEVLQAETELSGLELDDDDYPAALERVEKARNKVRVSVEESSNGVAMEALIERVQEQITQAEARLGYGTGEPKKESQTPDLSQFGLRSVDDLVNVTPAR